jgi:hypothetical protein
VVRSVLIGKKSSSYISQRSCAWHPPVLEYSNHSVAAVAAVAAAIMHASHYIWGFEQISSYNNNLICYDSP